MQYSESFTDENHLTTLKLGPFRLSVVADMKRRSPSVPEVNSRQAVFIIVADY